MSGSSDLFNRAVRSHQGGDLGQAEALYRQALELNPTLAGAYTNLGVVLQATDRGAEALACFRRSVELDPASADAHNNLAGALAGLGRRTEAIECYQQALRLNPNQADAYSNLGAALAEEGRFTEAVPCYRQALHINPRHVDAYNNLGLALGHQGQRRGPWNVFAKPYVWIPTTPRRLPILARLFRIKARWRKPVPVTCKRCGLTRMIHGLISISVTPCKPRDNWPRP